MKCLINNWFYVTENHRLLHWERLLLSPEVHSWPWKQNFDKTNLCKMVLLHCWYELVVPSVNVSYFVTFLYYKIPCHKDILLHTNLVQSSRPSHFFRYFYYNAFNMYDHFLNSITVKTLRHNRALPSKQRTIWVMIKHIVDAPLWEKTMRSCLSDIITGRTDFLVLSYHYCGLYSTVGVCNIIPLLWK